MIFPWLFRFFQIPWLFHAWIFFRDSLGFPWFPELVGTLVLGNFSCFFCHLLAFFKIFFFQKILSGTLSECQSLDPDQDQHSILVQTVSKVISRRQKLTFFKIIFFFKKFFIEHYQSVKAWIQIRTDILSGSKRFQKLSADDKNWHKQGKS